MGNTLNGVASSIARFSKEVLVKVIPAHDKLKHFYIGALGYYLFDMFFDCFTSLIMVLCGIVISEIAQKLSGGKNDFKEIVLDIIFTILPALLSNVVIEYGLV
jgi:hypothetical protein